MPEDEKPVSSEEVQTSEQSEQIGASVIEDGAVVEQPETEPTPEIVPEQEGLDITPEDESEIPDDQIKEKTPEEQEAELEQARKNVDEAYVGESDQTLAVDEKKDGQKNESETPEDQEQQSENEEMDRLLEEIMEEMGGYIGEEDRETVDKFSSLIKELLVEAFKSGGSKEKRENLQGKTWEQMIMEQFPGLGGVLLVIIIKLLMGTIETTKKSSKEAVVKPAKNPEK